MHDYNGPVGIPCFTLAMLLRTGVTLQHRGNAPRIDPAIAVAIHLLAQGSPVTNSKLHYSLGDDYSHLWRKTYSVLKFIPLGKRIAQYVAYLLWG